MRTKERGFRFAIVVAFCFALSAAAETGSVYYVSTDGTGLSPYDSWTTAATNVADALTLALATATAEAPATVFVGEGTFSPRAAGST